MHEAGTMRLCRTETFGCDEITPRRALAHGLDHIRRNRRRNQAELHFTEAVICAIHTDRNITCGHQPHATGITIALHFRDHRLAATVNRCQHRRQLTGIGEIFGMRVIRHLFHPVKISTGTKCGAVCRQYNRTHRRIRIECLKHLRNFSNRGFIERIAHIGAIQSHGGNPLIYVHGQRLQGIIIDCHCACLRYSAIIF